MKLLSVLAPTAAALLAGSPCTQVIVSPLQNTAAEGNTSGTYGIGNASAPQRFLQVHDDMAGNGRTISALAFRRDGPRVTTSYAAFSAVLSVVMSTAKTTASTPDKMFAANHGTDKQTVLSASLVQFPATSWTQVTEPFSYRIPLSTPFVFGGNGPLCWELQLIAQSNNPSPRLDAVSGVSSNPGAVTFRVGTGCKATGYTSGMFLTTSSNPNWPANSMNLTHSASRLPKSALVTVAIGTNHMSWGGVPLPFELPGSASAPSGPCNVYTDILVTVPALTNSSGNLTSSLGIVVWPGLAGFTAYSQIVALDAGANPLGIVTSNMGAHHVVAPWTTLPVGYVELRNSSGPQGTAVANRGLVAQLD